MSLISPIVGQQPVVPDLAEFGYNPFPNVQPFSQRSASGYQESLEDIIRFLQRKLIPYLQQSNPQGTWDANATALIAAVDAALTAQTADNAAKVSGAIDAIAQSQIIITDPAISAVLHTADSITRAWLDGQYSSKGETYVSPFDFGAVGDGVANDTAAMQAAIEKAESAWVESEFLSTVYKKIPSVVYLASATFSVNTLTVKKPIKFQGGGADGLAGNCLLQRTVGQSIVVLQCGSVSFEHIRFRSVSGTTAPNVAQVITDPAFPNTNSLFFRQCWFSTPETHAIWIKRGGDHQIIGCDFDVSGTGSIKLGDWANGFEAGSTKIHGNTFFNVALNCIEISKASDIDIAGNLAGTGGDGMPPLTSSRFLLISGGPSVRINAHHNILSNIGIAFNGYVGNTIGMLTVSHNTASVLTTFFRLETDGVLYNLNVQGNVISKSDSTAFSEAPIHLAGCGLETGIIKDNTVVTGALSPLLIDASDPRVTGNIIKDNIGQPFTNVHNLANAAANAA